MSTRQEKVREMLKVEISEIIHREMKDPRIGFVTITDVKISSDLRYARVYVSVLGDEVSQRKSLKGLNCAAGFVRAEIGKRIRMRVTPEIEFIFDKSIEQGVRIFELLQKINKDEHPEE